MCGKKINVNYPYIYLRTGIPMNCKTPSDYARLFAVSPELRGIHEMKQNAIKQYTMRQLQHDVLKRVNQLFVLNGLWGL